MKVWVEEERTEDVAVLYEGARREEVLDSGVVWSLRYGLCAGRKSHIASYFGARFVGLGDAYLWFDLRTAPSLPLLLRAIPVGRAFLSSLPYRLFAHVEPAGNCRFVQALGFRLIHLAPEGHYFVRDK